ncbi:hypothetical protein jhhlp_006941 [Lomentospora prolificans]|uniref:Uncharacterized protein n=1 Tax=Lomentospora prolificans TaxID=41688 RepID=A0A2N3N356_9PEZI|nr:hypothetical protein jhhlp_006941 [Lomentospora prolificans]
MSSLPDHKVETEGVSGESSNAKRVLPLPEPSLKNTQQQQEQQGTLDVSRGGSTVKLDHLGPLVVNQDGTMSRIANWSEMAEIEKENTLRILGKRNQIRLQALRTQAESTKGGRGSNVPKSE